MPRFLLQFYHRPNLEEFRGPEVHALLQLNNIDPHACSASFDSRSPFVEFYFESSEVALNFVERGIIVKAAFEVFGEGCSFERTLSSMAERHQRDETSSGDETWSMRVEGIGRSFSKAEQECVRGNFQNIMQECGMLQGRVDLHHPSSQWVIAVEGNEMQGKHKLEEEQEQEQEQGKGQGLVWPFSRNTSKVWLLREVGRSLMRSSVGAHKLNQ